MGGKSIHLERFFKIMGYNYVFKIDFSQMHTLHFIVGEFKGTWSWNCLPFLCVTAPEGCIHPPRDSVDPAEIFIRGDIPCYARSSICRCLSTGALALCRLDLVGHKQKFLPASLLASELVSKPESHSINSASWEASDTRWRSLMRWVQTKGAPHVSRDEPHPGVFEGFEI